MLHSSYSNIRLESYLFTRQAFEDVKSRLKPDGMFVMYNYFRQGWIVARLEQGLTEVFGAAPLVMTLPYQNEVDPDEASRLHHLPGRRARHALSAALGVGARRATG